MPRPHFFRTEKEGEGPAGTEGMGRSKSAVSPGTLSTSKNQQKPKVWIKQCVCDFELSLEMRG